ncbi:MAG TPA: dihydropteroate synthase [Chitinophagaceae bacterium]|nr:dihydropteroate synthase [Chitinophagaceae bacterium]
MFTLNCHGRLQTFDSPIVMGIINVTHDSFYSSGRTATVKDALRKAEQMIAEGAAILDIGGQSTRPGSKLIEPKEEAERVIPVIEAIHKQLPDAIISIDTFYASVAEQSVQAGASIINDVSGGNFDKAMLSTAARLKVPFVCMHIKGTPQNMQQNPVYENVTKEIVDYFIERVDDCAKAGIHDVIIDPGFGFGKTIAHNFQLLRNLSIFKIFGKPILLGISRKSTIYKTLGVTAEEALNGTTVLHTLGLLNGANILRVHDVKEAVEATKLVTQYLQ